MIKTDVKRHGQPRIKIRWNACFRIRTAEYVCNKNGRIKDIPE